jgi:type VI protein secretion system component VasF
MKMNLESLIAPVLQKVCEYCVFKDSGYETPQDVMLAEIRSELNSISQRCISMPMLLQQYQAIEKPLIFFIDYTVKEGGFSFSKDYRELARSFNEFSGDDKFFDLLNNALQLNDDKEVIKVFYLLMGLGFDGYYKRRRSEIIDVMEQTAAHLKKSPDFNAEALTPEISVQKGSEAQAPKGFFSRPAYWVAALGAFLLVSFFASWASLSANTSEFMNAVEAASEVSTPYSGNNSPGFRIQDSAADAAQGGEAE